MSFDKQVKACYYKARFYMIFHYFAKLIMLLIICYHHFNRSLKTLIGGEPFAYVQSPVMYDPGMGIQYQATTTFSAAGAGSSKP